MSVSEKQKEHAKKYQSKFDDIKVRVPRGKKTDYLSKLPPEYTSLNKFIIDAIEEKFKQYETSDH